MRVWTKEEDELLAELFLKKSPVSKYHEAFPSATPCQIYNRRKKLGLVKPAKRWTEQEDLSLKAAWREGIAKAVEALPDRSEAGIRVRASVLGLTKKRKTRYRWTEEMDRFIVTQYPVHGAGWVGWKTGCGDLPYPVIRQRAVYLGARKARGGKITKDVSETILDRLGAVAQDCGCSFCAAFFKPQGFAA